MHISLYSFLNSGLAQVLFIAEHVISTFVTVSNCKCGWTLTSSIRHHYHQWRPDGELIVAGIPTHLLSWLQSVMNAAARFISSSGFDHITPLLRQLHWLKASERIAFKSAVLVYKCLQGLHHFTVSMNCVKWRTSRLVSDSVLPRLHHWSSAALNYPQSETEPFCTVARIWNSLPQHVTSAPSLLVFRSRLKTHLFTIFHSSLWPCLVVTQWHLSFQTL